MSMFKHVFKTPSVQIFLLLRKFCLVEVGLLETRLCKVPIKVVRSTCVDVMMSRSLGYSRSQSSPTFYHRTSEGQRSIYTLLYISTWSRPVPTSANWLHVAFSKGTSSPGPPCQDLPPGHSLRPPTVPFPTLHFGDLYIASGADTSDVRVWIDCPLVPGGVGLVHLLVPCDVRRSMSQLGISQRTQGPPREGGWGVIRALAGSHAAASYLFVPFVSFCGLGWTWTG